MQNNTEFREIAPGVLLSGTRAVAMQQNNDGVNITILPEKNSVSYLYVNASQAQHYAIDVHFYHEHTALTLFGLYQLDGQKIAAIRTGMHHHVPHCDSKQVWRGVLTDEAKAAFDAKIIVYPQAQKTNAQLSNKNLLLSKTAAVNTKPTLEIYADDVKCSHGATVGCLDEQALFYLRARGIDAHAARRILVQAFIDEVVREPHDA